MNKKYIRIFSGVALGVLIISSTLLIYLNKNSDLYSRDFGNTAQQDQVRNQIDEYCQNLKSKNIKIENCPIPLCYNECWRGTIGCNSSQRIYNTRVDIDGDTRVIRMDVATDSNFDSWYSFEYIFNRNDDIEGQKITHSSDGLCTNEEYNKLLNIISDKINPLILEYCSQLNKLSGNSSCGSLAATCSSSRIKTYDFSNNNTKIAVNIPIIYGRNDRPGVTTANFILDKGLNVLENNLNATKDSSELC